MEAKKLLVISGSAEKTTLFQDPVTMFEILVWIFVKSIRLLFTLIFYMISGEKNQTVNLYINDSVPFFTFVTDLNFILPLAK